MIRKYFTTALIITSFLSSASLALQDPNRLELASPKNDDHFEVTKPLFFWKSVPGTQSYEVYVDDAKAGAVPSAPGSVVHYGLTTPLVRDNTIGMLR